MMGMKPVWRWVNVACVVTVTIGAANVASAQAIRGADRISARAAAESLKVLRQLDSTTRAKPADAAVWHRRGMIAFALMELTTDRDTMPGLDYRTLRLVAADALQTARNLDPYNNVYARSLSQDRDRAKEDRQHVFPTTSLGLRSPSIAR